MVDGQANLHLPMRTASETSAQAFSHLSLIDPAIDNDATAEHNCIAPKSGLMQCLSQTHAFKLMMIVSAEDFLLHWPSVNFYIAD